jgi:hypothetical protein
VLLAQQIDAALTPSPFNPLPSDFNNQLNIPFVVIVGVLGFIQLCCSLVMIFLNSDQLSNYLHVCSTIAFLSSFALGVTLTTSIINFNQIVQAENNYDYIIPTYYVLQVDGMLNFLFSVPLLFYVCYQSVEDYLIRPN